MRIAATQPVFYKNYGLYKPTALNENGKSHRC